MLAKTLGHIIVHESDPLVCWFIHLLVRSILGVCAHVSAHTCACVSINGVLHLQTVDSSDLWTCLSLCLWPIGRCGCWDLWRWHLCLPALYWMAGFPHMPWTGALMAVPSASWGHWSPHHLHHLHGNYQGTNREYHGKQQQTNRCEGVRPSVRHIVISHWYLWYLTKQSECWQLDGSP